MDRNEVTFDVEGDLWALPLPEHLHLKTKRGPGNRTVPAWETRLMDERLLELYNLEFRHLRETAAEFGRDYPRSPAVCRSTWTQRRFVRTPTSSDCWKGSRSSRLGSI